ncbi:hypothetical protein [Kitasatospora sp. LaBMicrA B282]|uniref:hypothetical protein n=1 Tax=Kitasatospora sp. LaBMicrA B282 TaxID=3420949 RepID=UPI003D10A7B8
MRSLPRTLNACGALAATVLLTGLSAGAAHALPASDGVLVAHAAPRAGVNMFAQPTVPTTGLGASGSTTVNMTTGDGSSAVPGASGDVLTFTAPAGVQITDVFCGSGTTKTIAPDGSSATCNSTAGGNWDVGRSISYTVSPNAATGTLTGGASLTQASTGTSTGTWAVNVALNQLTQPSVPTTNLGSSGSTTVNLTGPGGSGSVPAQTGDVLTFNAPPGVQITDITCGDNKQIAPDGSWATCTSTGTNGWNVARSISYTVSPNAGGPTLTAPASLLRNGAFIANGTWSVNTNGTTINTVPIADPAVAGGTLAAAVGTGYLVHRRRKADSAS